MKVQPILPLTADKQPADGASYSLLMWGRIGTSAGLGRAVLGSAQLGDCATMGGIYQRRHSKKGPVLALLRDYAPTNPRTELQQANRQKMADAMANWNNLTTEQKNVYNLAASKKGLKGYNLFVKQYITSQ
jgi:hypothetical protein